MSINLLCKFGAAHWRSISRPFLADRIRNDLTGWRSVCGFAGEVTQQQRLETLVLPYDFYIICSGQLSRTMRAVSGERQLVRIKKYKPIVECAARFSKLSEFADRNLNSG